MSLALHLAPQAKAVVIAYEGFDYLAGDYIGGSNPSANPDTGTGWSANWAGQASRRHDFSNEAGLSYSKNGISLAVVGNKVAGRAHNIVEGQSNWNTLTATRSVTTQSVTLGEASTWWSSVLIQQSSRNYASVALLASAGNHISFGILTNNTNNFEISAGGVITASTNSPITLNSVEFLVMKVAVDALGNLTTSLFLNPELSAEPAAMTAILTVSTPYSGSGALPFGGFNGVRLITNGATNYLDEIRVGTTFADVAPLSAVPEPHVGILALIGGVASMLHRRRSRHSKSTPF